MRDDHADPKPPLPVPPESADDAISGAAAAPGAGSAGDGAAPLLTRAQLRATRGPAPHVELPRAAATAQPTLFVALLASALLLSIAAFRSPAVVAATTGVLGVIVALGWPVLWPNPAPLGATLAIAIVAIGAAIVTVVPDAPPWLAGIPVILAAATLVLFVHQLARRDGRHRLVESLSGTALGMAMVVLGVGYAALARGDLGTLLVVVAASAAAVGGVADLLAGRALLRPWLLPFAMVLGAGAAVAAGALIGGGPGAGHLALYGLVCGGVAHGGRRLTASLPGAGGKVAQVSAGAASLLFTGIIAYALGRILVPA